MKHGSTIKLVIPIPSKMIRSFIGKVKLKEETITIIIHSNKELPDVFYTELTALLTKHCNNENDNI